MIKLLLEALKKRVEAEMDLINTMGQVVEKKYKELQKNSEKLQKNSEKLQKNMQHTHINKMKRASCWGILNLHLNFYRFHNKMKMVKMCIQSFPASTSFLFDLIDLMPYNMSDSTFNELLLLMKKLDLSLLRDVLSEFEEYCKKINMQYFWDLKWSALYQLIPSKTLENTRS